MAQQNLAVIQMKRDVFGASTDMADSASLEPGGEVLGQGKPQLGAALFDPHQATTLQDRPQAAYDGLDFGEFGHSWVRRLPRLWDRRDDAARLGPRVA